MAVSARNQLTGTVSAVATGAVNDEVELTLAGGAKLVAIVTIAVSRHWVWRKERSHCADQSAVGDAGD
jgi:molybdopterin-binding protein